jgi:hypothetical protein
MGTTESCWRLFDTGVPSSVPSSETSVPVEWLGDTSEEFIQPVGRLYAAALCSLGMLLSPSLSVLVLPAGTRELRASGSRMVARFDRPRQARIADKEATLTTGLAVVLREHPRVAALQHVVHALDDLVDNSWQWSIARACALESEDPGRADGGARRLLARMVARQPLAEMDTFYRQAQLSAGLVNAAQRGNTELVGWLLGHIVSERFTVDSYSGIFKAVEAAAAHGHLDILEQVLVHDKRGVSIKPAMISAARGDCMDTLRSLYKRLKSPVDLSDCTSSLLEAAAGNGSVEMADWVVEIVGADSLRLSVAGAVQSAIAGGHPEMIKNLVDIAASIDGPLCLDGAAAKGYLQALQWGLEHGGVCSSQAMDNAASNGHLDVVRWLHQHRADGCSTQALNKAASNGHLRVVQWLHYNRSEGCTTEAMDGAASHGHVEVVKWLHLNRGEGCTTAAMDGAASHGHFDVVKWLHYNRSEGCTQAAVDGAASRGDVAVIEWFIAHRSESCNTSRSALENAAAHGQLDAVQWLFKHNRVGDASEWIASDAMDRAASGGHLEVVKWFHERRPEIGSCSTAALDGAAANGHLQTVTWLHANRREGATYRAMDEAAAGGHLEVMMFLHSHCSCGCTSDAAVLAAQNEHVEVVQWLLQHYPQQGSNEKVRKFASRYNFSLLDRCPAGAY